MPDPSAGVRGRQLEGAEERGGLVCWEWERGDVRGQDVLDSNLSRTLRMPLSTPAAGWGCITLYREFGGEGLLLDVNYPSNLFQKELALATEEPLGKAVAAVLS